MRLGTVQRRQSWAWWGAIGIAVLIMGAYVLFDILDVDGSQGTGWPADDIVMAEGAPAQADRFVRVDPITPDLIRLRESSLSRWFTSTWHRRSPGAPLLRTRQCRNLPRVKLRPALTQTSPRSTDPA